MRKQKMIAENVGCIKAQMSHSISGNQNYTVAMYIIVTKKLTKAYKNIF
jgi:hypothetical protein